MKTITNDQYNRLSKDIISSLNSGSLMTLRAMGYIDAGDVIKTLMSVQKVEMVD